MWQAFVTMQSTYKPVPFVSSNSTFLLLGNRTPKLRCPLCHVTVEVGNMIAMLLCRGFWSLSDRCVIVSMFVTVLFLTGIQTSGSYSQCSHAFINLHNIYALQYLIILRDFNFS